MVGPLRRVFEMNSLDSPRIFAIVLRRHGVVDFDTRSHVFHSFRFCVKRL